MVLYSSEIKRKVTSMFCKSGELNLERRDSDKEPKWSMFRLKHDTYQWRSVAVVREFFSEEVIRAKRKRAGLCPALWCANKFGREALLSSCKSKPRSHTLDRLTGVRRTLADHSSSPRRHSDYTSWITTLWLAWEGSSRARTCQLRSFRP